MGQSQALLREAIFSMRKRAYGRCIPAGSEMNILYGSRPARSRRRWKSCTAWQSMSTNQPCGIWNESGREKRECRTGRNEPFGAKQKRKAGALSFFGIRGKVRRSNWITTPMRDGKKKLFIAMQNPQKICRRGGGRTASGVGEREIEPGN